MKNYTSKISRYALVLIAAALLFNVGCASKEEEPITQEAEVADTEKATGDETTEVEEEAKLMTAFDVTGHRYKLQDDSYEATDTSGGYRHYLCEDCGEEYDYTTDPLVYEINPKTGEPVNQQGSINPILPSYEHVPDGEPQVFWSKEDKEWRVYLYGSHDVSGTSFCGTNYVVWSAPVYDLSDWRYDGISLDISEESTYGGDILYAPDCAYDLMTDSYYMISNQVYDYAVLRVSDNPTKWEEDKAVWRGTFKTCYDPAIYIENGTIYVTGACRKTEESVTDTSVYEAIEADGYTTGAGQVAVLYQLKEDTTDGDGIEKTSWLPNDERIYTPIYEGPSIYYSDDLGVYLYMYVSVESGADGSEYKSNISYMWTDDLMNGTWHYGENNVNDEYESEYLCGGKGNIISDTSGRYYRDAETGEMTFADFPTYSYSNNHGGMTKVNGKYYFFGHRHTNKDSFSRQAIIGQLNVYKDENGQPVIEPMEFTSAGAADSLDAYQVWNAEVTTYLLQASDHPAPSNEAGNPHTDCVENAPYIVATRDQDATHASYIANLSKDNIVGYRYLNFGDTDTITSLKMLVNQSENAVDGTVDVYLDEPINGQKIGSLTISKDIIANSENETDTSGVVWSWISGQMEQPVSGTHAVYFVFNSDQEGTICALDQFGFTAQ